MQIKYSVTFVNEDGSEDRYGSGLLSSERIAYRRQAKAIKSSLRKGRSVAVSSVDLDDEGNVCGSDFIDVSDE